MKNQFSKFAFFASAILIIFVTFSYPRWEMEEVGATISWDVSGYYLYLPAFLIYQNPDKLDFFPEIQEKYEPSYGFYEAYKVENGNYIFKYSGGMAILYLPSFLVGHTIAHLTDYPADGYSAPYQTSLYLGSMLFGLLGLWIMRRNLLYFFSDKVVGAVVICIAFGTNYLNYVTIDAAMPHNYLFTLYAFLIYFTIRFYQKPTFLSAIFIGLTGGLAALARPTEVLMMLIPVLWGLYFTQENWKHRLHFLKNNLSKISIAVVIYLLLGMLQLVYWKTYSGNWLEYSYQDQGFSWFSPHFINVFFSYKKGWLIYTPIMILTLIGFWFLYKNHKHLFGVTVIFFFLNTWVISSWDIWWYGGGFGQRAFIQSFPLIVFSMAAFIEFIFTKKWWRIGIGVFAAFCFWLNLFQTWQAHWGPFETENMTKAYYWRIFGKTEKNQLDRFLLDTKHDFQGERKNVRTIFKTDFEKPEFDTLTFADAKSGKKAIFVNQKNLRASAANLIVSDDWKVIEKSWLRISGEFYCSTLTWDMWSMPQMVIKLKKGDQKLRNTQIRPHRILKKKEWQTVWIDIPIYDLPIDNIEIFLLSSGNLKDLAMDDMKVEIYEE